MKKIVMMCMLMLVFAVGCQSSEDNSKEDLADVAMEEQEVTDESVSSDTVSENISADIEENEEAEPEEIVDPAVIPATVVDGIYHNAYYNVEDIEGLDPEILNYLEPIINAVETENYNEALNLLNYEEVLSYTTMTPEFLTDNEFRCNYSDGEYKIYIELYEFFSDAYCERKLLLYILPTGNGNGYGLAKVYMEHGGEGYLINDQPAKGIIESETFLVGECTDGVFSSELLGEYHHNSSTYINDNLDDNYYYTYEISANATNGLLDGDLSIVTTDSSWDSYYWEDYQAVFEDGKVVFDDTNGNSVVNVYSNGEFSHCIVPDDGGIMCLVTEEEIKSMIYTVDVLFMMYPESFYNISYNRPELTSYEEIDGGMRYYYW